MYVESNESLQNPVSKGFLYPDNEKSRRVLKDPEPVRKCEKRGIRNSNKRGDANPLK